MNKFKRLMLLKVQNPTFYETIICGAKKLFRLRIYLKLHKIFFMLLKTSLTRLSPLFTISYDLHPRKGTDEIIALEVNYENRS